MTKQTKTKRARNSAKLTRANESVKSVPQLALGRNLCYGFPPKLLTKLRYCDTIPLTSTVGSLAKNIFYVNSTFDPDNTGTGHQPLYRDTFAAIYDQYAVVSAQIKVTFVNMLAIPLMCGLAIDDDNSISANYNVLAEQNLSQMKLVPALTGSVSSTNMTFSWSCVKHLGIDPYASETYKTAIGANPTEVASVGIWGQPVDLTTTGTFYAHVEIDQVVLFTELTTPTQS